MTFTNVLVVDAANVIGSRPDGWWKDRPGAAVRLCRGLLDTALPYDLIVVVLEGHARAGVPEGEQDAVRVMHADGSGDDVLVQVCAEYAASKLTLATADRGLISRVAHLECRSWVRAGCGNRSGCDTERGSSTRVADKIAIFPHRSGCANISIITTRRWGMDAAQQQRRSGSLLIYLLVAYPFTWALWISSVMMAQEHSWPMPSPDNYARLVAEGVVDSAHFLWALVFTVAVYGPLLAALAAVGHAHGRRGIRRLMASTFDPRVAPRWYSAALALAAAIAFLPALAALVTGSLAPSVVDMVGRLVWFVPLLLLQLITSGLGEEPGWRGYLLPELQRRFSDVRTVWLLGLAWAIWHYPLTILYAAAGVPTDAPAVALIATVTGALVAQTLGVIGLTYVYVWLFNRTASIFLMIVFHALTNTLPFLVPRALGPWALAAGVFPWVVVLVLWLITRPHFLRPRIAA